MPPLDLRLPSRLGEEAPSLVVWGPPTTAHTSRLGASPSPPTDASGLRQGCAQGHRVPSLVLRCRSFSRVSFAAFFFFFLIYFFLSVFFLFLIMLADLLFTILPKEHCQ